MYKSGIQPVTCVLPQGGILSPLLWLMFFNGVTRTIEDRRGEVKGAIECSPGFIYADDITARIAEESKDRLMVLARPHFRRVRGAATLQ